MTTYRSAAFAIAVCLSAPAAQAGWTATQTQKVVGTPNTQSVTLHFEDGKLRVDDPSKNISVVVSMDSAEFLHIDHSKKAFAKFSASLLKAKRDEALNAMKAQLPKLPAQQRAQAEAQLKALEAAEKPDLKKLGRSDKVEGVVCELYGWTGPQGPTEACIATKTPVDTRGFQKSAQKLSAQFQTMGGTEMGLALVQLSHLGFPVRTRMVRKAGKSSIELVTEVGAFKKANHKKSAFEAPSTYKTQTFEQIMSR